MSTLLERFDKYGMTYGTLTSNDRTVTADEIRRALAIAHAVDDLMAMRTPEAMYTAGWIKARADELLEGK